MSTDKYPSVFFELNGGDFYDITLYIKIVTVCLQNRK